jgi:hypothetical protein
VVTLDRFRDKHLGERAWIVCTGPSLDLINTSFLEGETLIGMNRGYLKEGLDYTYLCVIDDLVIDQFGKEIKRVPVKGIFTGGKLKGNNIYNLHWRGNEPFFQTDITQPMWQGHTVTYVAMQVAFFMGFDEVYCIGLDHFTDYSNVEKAEGKGHVTVGKDPNHFEVPGGYFGEGVRWQRQDKKSVELAYMLASWYYRKHRKDYGLYNATEGTNLPERIIPHYHKPGLYK